MKCRRAVGRRARVPARHLPVIAVFCLGCAAVVTADELQVDEPEADDPVPAGLAVTPDAIEPAAPPPADPTPTSVEASARACIDDVRSDALGRWPAEHEWMPDFTSGDLSIRPLPDIDGDGHEESLVTIERLCGVTGNCPLLFYRTADDCIDYVGALWSAYEAVLPRTREGMHDFETWVKGGCAGLEGTLTRWRWKGGAYEPYATIDCDCNDEDPKRHPDCPG